MKIPRLGLGTWELGDREERRADEIAALRLGLDLGLTMIDPAEMYGAGRAESLVGEAIAGRREELRISPMRREVYGADTRFRIGLRHSLATHPPRTAGSAAAEPLRMQRTAREPVTSAEA